jgi:hypothetical protein
MPLIKRTVKGTPLTFAEGDANLDYLEAIALNTGSLATTGSNVFRASQNIVGGTLSVQSATVTAGAFTSTQNHFTELSLQNTSVGPSASADFVVYGNNGTLFDHYIDMGINNSGFSSNYLYNNTYLGRADDAYFYHVGGDFKIGNATSSSLYQSLYLFANPSGNIDLAITGGMVGIKKSGSLSATLDVNGSAAVSSYLTLSQVSSSFNFADDTAASGSGIPLGGLYHTSGTIKIRLV